ncbi:hypothetical protein XELAEV_18047485mg [Xenopus laevis]|uniref:Protein kinase domain-containing protein n=1 Tax=Xenopus laevis TaxID=8355 RepID=A0A974H1Y5_XENLA|nr:hypothetical protein XELAEV_18047485mg [Xenopus laevis]
MDYCPGGDLASYMNHRSFPKETAVFYSGCIVLGLQFLHERHIIHRDIKPQNILLNWDGYARITDFGISKKTAGYDGKAYTACGSLSYMAPEIFSSNNHGKSVDWWALGVLLYKMLLNKLPFNAFFVETLFKRIKENEPNYPKNLDEDATSIIQNLLRKNPQERLGSKCDAEELKESSFFKELDFDALSKKQIKAPIIPQEKTPGCCCGFLCCQRQIVLSE